MESNKTLFLIRGLPGSGKTSLANSISKMVVEADQYFTIQKSPEGRIFRGYDAGEYCFDPNLLPKAHKYCHDVCENFLKDGYYKVVVSNTFTKESELEPYFELAKKYNYRVVSIIVENRHEGKSTHDVPEETIKKMKDRFSIKL